jgi:hypothetical protein
VSTLRQERHRCRKYAAAPPASVDPDGFPFFLPGLPDSLVEGRVLSFMMYNVAVSDLIVFLQINREWHELIIGTLEWQMFQSIMGQPQLIAHAQDPPRAYVAFVSYLFELHIDRYGVCLERQRELGLNILRLGRG